MWIWAAPKGKLGQLTPGIKYTGCDFTMPETSNHFDFHHCDFNHSELPVSVHGTPLVACSGLLEYIEDLDLFLKKINYILSDNGILIASYFNMNHISRIMQMMKGGSFKVHPDWRGFYSPNDFTLKLKNTGFILEKIYPVSHGFTNSQAVSETTGQRLVIPRFRFYSKMLAHQLIFVCRKKKVKEGLA